MGDLYPLHNTPCRPNSSSSHALTATTATTWHNRLGHPGLPSFNSMRRTLFLDCNNKSPSRHYNSCELGKHIKLPFFPSMTYTYSPFDIVYSDLWTSPVRSTMGHQYYILFLDDFTNFLWTYPIQNKSQAFNIFTDFHKYISTQFTKVIKTFQCDNGKEYDNHFFRRHFLEHGIHFRFSCPHTSSQNGKAERKIKTINNIVRTLLLHVSQPPSFWHHALSMATYLHNILPSKANHNLTPTLNLYLRHPSYTELRTFGCFCYPIFPLVAFISWMPVPHRVFLGYPSHH